MITLAEEFLFWLICFLRTRAVFGFPMPLKGIFWAILRWILDLMYLSKLIDLFLDLDFGLSIYYSCFKADGTRRKSADCYWKWCSKHFHQQVLKQYTAASLKIWWNWKTRHTWRPFHATWRNLLFPSPIIFYVYLRKIRAWKVAW